MRGKLLAGNETSQILSNQKKLKRGGEGSNDDSGKIVYASLECT